jgi:hypothetical protein
VAAPQLRVAAAMGERDEAKVCMGAAICNEGSAELRVGANGGDGTAGQLRVRAVSGEDAVEPPSTMSIPSLPNAPAPDQTRVRTPCGNGPSVPPPAASALLSRPRLPFAPNSIAENTRCGNEPSALSPAAFTLPSRPGPFAPDSTWERTHYGSEPSKLSPSASLLPPRPGPFAPDQIRVSTLCGLEPSALSTSSPGAVARCDTRALPLRGTVRAGAAPAAAGHANTRTGSGFLLGRFVTDEHYFGTERRGKPEGPTA